MSNCRESGEKKRKLESTILLYTKVKSQITRKESIATHRDNATKHFTEVPSLLPQNPLSISEEDLIKLERADSRLANKLPQLQELEGKHLAQLERDKLEARIMKGVNGMIK